ncbi:MAG: hypothetical protein FD181_1421 [Prolixibacteraceae bacterium]|nr:MAG: hypothetical protein FD181_1421 [Prolixibacteraceae bacterium]
MSFKPKNRLPLVTNEGQVGDIKIDELKELITFLKNRSFYIQFRENGSLFKVIQSYKSPATPRLQRGVGCFAFVMLF